MGYYIDSAMHGTFASLINSLTKIEYEIDLHVISLQ